MMRLAAEQPWLILPSYRLSVNICHHFGEQSPSIPINNIWRNWGFFLPFPRIRWARNLRSFRIHHHKISFNVVRIWANDIRRCLYQCNHDPSRVILIPEVIQWKTSIFRADLEVFKIKRVRR